MYDHLYEYLILYRQLNVQGIGSFVVERKAAQTDFTQRLISPASYSISLHPANETPSKKFFQWLADRLGIAYHEAIMKYNGFVFDLRSYILEGHKVTWPEVGILSKGISGEIKLEPAISSIPFDRPVSAVRVIREKAVHNVRVGEDEKTSVEMTELLHPDEVKKSYWWKAALVAGIVLIIVLAFYLFQKGFRSSSASNQQKLVPQKSAVTHRQLS
jgi:hypothetical protein